MKSILIVFALFFVLNLSFSQDLKEIEEGNTIFILFDKNKEYINKVVHQKADSFEASYCVYHYYFKKKR